MAKVHRTRTKTAIHDNEILGLPRLLFVPLNNVEPVQFGNPAERRLLEIPDARVCTVHCLCDRQAKHFRSSYYSRINILLMPLRREKVHVRHFYLRYLCVYYEKGLAHCIHIKPM